LGVQNACPVDEGAYTGEVSFTMTRGLVHYGLVGHSERRIRFNETLDTIRDKVTAAVRNGITPILCVGETKEEHRNGETRQVIHDQLVTALHNLTAHEIATIVVAYEPVWAISTFDGEIAKPHVIQKEIDFIRMQIGELYGDNIGRSVRVLYGGSVDEFDVCSYLELQGCDGTLVGAASLNYHKFATIVDNAYRMVHSE
jgi:triosephosphate isomerase